MTHQKPVFFNCLFALLLILCLTGCKHKQDEENKLNHFLTETKQMPPQSIAPLPAFVTPESPKSLPVLKRNPFSPEINTQQEKPTLNHVPTALETFSLNELHYVGNLSEGKRIVALITAPNKLVYTLTIGEYIGKNYGKVTSITPQTIHIEEMVADGLGGWTKRANQLSLYTQTTQDSAP